METKQKEAKNAAQEEKEETIRKLNEEKKAVEESLEDETQRLLQRLKKISQLNEALNTENQNLRVDIRKNPAAITELINYKGKLEQTVSVRDKEIRRLEGIFQSPRMLNYNSRSTGRCWGCGGGPGHDWSFSCRRGY